VLLAKIFFSSPIRLERCRRAKSAFQCLEKIILPLAMACNTEERTEPGKKSRSRAVGRMSRKTARTLAAKKLLKRVTSRKGVSPYTRGNVASSLKLAVIDVVDEPIPDFTPVTEFDETRVALPDPEAPMSRDIARAGQPRWISLLIQVMRHSASA
jgi:hypothetical protein